LGALVLSAWSPALGLLEPAGEPPAAVQTAGSAGSVLAFAPGLGRTMKRVRTRMEHSGERFADALGEAGTLWFWILIAMAEFFVVAAFTSVADFRMLDLRRQGRGALSRYLGHGMRTFFRVLRDRRTPWLPRLLIIGAMLYWVLPRDLFPDETFVPGLLDDFVIAVCATKAFLRLCPDTLVAKHAADVEAQAHA